MARMRVTVSVRVMDRVRLAVEFRFGLGFWTQPAHYTWTYDYDGRVRI